MTTATRQRPTTKPATPEAGEAPAQPPRPAIWLQVVLPGGASQPIGIALDDPAWEQTLDNAVTQIKLLVMRDLLNRQLAAATPSATNGKQG